MLLALALFIRREGKIRKYLKSEKMKGRLQVCNMLMLTENEYEHEDGKKMAKAFLSTLSRSFNKT